MNVLVACEFSGVVRDAFAARGHDAWSCDLLPSETPGQHYQGNVRDMLNGPKRDLMIAHPPCTHLAVSGARWFKDKQQEQAEALDFVRMLLGADIPRICLENPISIISSRIRKPDQIIQPWQFGHPETKATCLWLKNLPLLTPTNIVDGREARVHKLPPSPDRWKDRSRTYTGIAKAMAERQGQPHGWPNYSKPMNETKTPENQCPIDEAEREAVLAAPTGYAPSYADLLEAVKAYKLWDMAEEKNLGTFHDKMDLCSYAQWAGSKALGLPHEPEWRGVPRLTITMREGA